MNPLLLLTFAGRNGPLMLFAGVFIGLMVPALANGSIGGYVVADPFNAMAQVRKIGRITRYETKTYVGESRILDLDKSARPDSLPELGESSAPGPSAERRRLCVTSESGLVWSMNCESWLLPKYSFTTALTGFALIRSCGMSVSIS